MSFHWSQPGKARFQLLVWGDAATGQQFEPLSIATTLLMEESGLPVDVQIVADPAHDAFVQKVRARGQWAPRRSAKAA